MKHVAVGLFACICVTAAVGSAEESIPRRREGPAITSPSPGYLRPGLRSLPAGSLQLLMANPAGALFLDLDRIRREGDRIEAVDLVVWYPPLREANGKEIAYSVRQEWIDCATRAVHEGASSSFSEAGEVVVELPADPDRRGWHAPKPGAVSDMRLKVLCDGVAMLAEYRVAGHAAARSLAQSVGERP